MTAPKKYPFLDLATVNAPYLDELEQATLRVVRSGRYIGGEEVDALEHRIADIANTPHAVAVSNGLDALRLILRAYIEMGRLHPADEVIVPANTYIASVLAISDAGLTPVLAEPDALTSNLDIHKASRLVNGRTRAIMPVHLYGRVCFSEELADMATRHNLLIIEDNAQAIGATSDVAGLYGTHATGGLGHAAGLSFYPTKTWARWATLALSPPTTPNLPPPSALSPTTEPTGAITTYTADSTAAWTPSRPPCSWSNSVTLTRRTTTADTSPQSTAPP